MLILKHKGPPILIVICSILSFGCTPTIDTNYSFIDEKEDAIVIASLPASSLGRTMCFQRYDPSKNKKIRGFSEQSCISTYNPFRKVSQVYTAISLKPGYYFVSQISTTNGSAKSKKYLNTNVISFQASNHKALYLGDFDITEFTTIEHLGFNEPAAQKYLLTFTKILMKLDTAIINRTNISLR